MPTYDYECLNGHRFEIFQRISDDAVAECPECGAEARRLISGGAGFLFKGDGFYITDYRSKEYKEKASKEPGAAPTASGSDGSSSGTAGSSSPGGDAASGGGSESAAGGGSDSSSGGSSGSASGGGSSPGGSPKSTDS